VSWHSANTQLHLLLTLCCFAGGCLGESSREYDRAVSEFRAGNYAAAAELFARADAGSPGTTDALLYKAKCLVHISDFAEAEQSLRGYLQSRRNSSDALYMLGFVLNRLNRPADSLATYTQAAALTPPTADDLKIVGLDYVLLNDYADAIKWLGKAVSVDGKNKDAWYYLGRAYYTQSQLFKAKEAFLRALQLDPRDPKAENGLGLVFESNARLDEAMDAYQKAIAWQIDNPHKSEQPYANLGNLLLEQGRTADAIKALENAVKIAPGNAYGRLRLGTAYLRAAELQKAEGELESAAELDPENPGVHYQLGRLYKELHQLDRAKVEFGKTEQLQSNAARSEARSRN